MNPYFALGAVLAAIAIGGAGYWKGWEDRAARCNVAALERQLRDIEVQREHDQEAIADRDEKIAELEAREPEVIERVRTVTNTLPGRIEQIFVDVPSCPVNIEALEGLRSDLNSLRGG